MVVLLPSIPPVISKVFVYYPIALNFLKNTEHVLLFHSHKDAALLSVVSYIKDHSPLFETLFLTDFTLLSQWPGTPHLLTDAVQQRSPVPAAQLGPRPSAHPSIPDDRLPAGPPSLTSQDTGLPALGLVPFVAHLAETPCSMGHMTLRSGLGDTNVPRLWFSSGHL